MSARITGAISGYVKSGFEGVRAAFIENFALRDELGAACCIYHRGEKVVDIWGGVRDKRSGAPWKSDTMALIFSATKGLAAMTLALAESRGLLDYDARICAYWPEFAQQGKEYITIRQLLAHQAALFAFGEPVTKQDIADLDKLAAILARQKPAWEPGTRQAYHAISLGFYEGELLRRVDPKHRTLGQFFQDEIAAPLDPNVYIRLPEEISDSRLATLQMSNYLLGVFHNPIRMTMAALEPRSPLHRSMVENPGTVLALDPDHIYARNFEVPSGGGVGTARAIARAYSAFVNGGHELGLRAETLRELMADPVPPLYGFYDACLQIEAPFALGFAKPNPQRPFGYPGAFGAPGAGGSFAYADPEVEVGYAYVMNRMGTYLIDPRDIALRVAMYRALGVAPPWETSSASRGRRMPNVLR